MSDVSDLESCHERGGSYVVNWVISFEDCFHLGQIPHKPYFGSVFLYQCCRFSESCINLLMCLQFPGDTQTFPQYTVFAHSLQSCDKLFTVI